MCVRIVAMSISVADGITLERNEKNVGSRIVIASTFPIRVVLDVSFLWSAEHSLLKKC
jgi:hypothetical protein